MPVTPLSFVAAPPLFETPGNGLSDTIAADFNSDGRPDLAVVNGLSSTVAVMLNSGSGRLSAGPTATMVGGAFAAADFNRDGNLDLALITGSPTDRVGVMLGDGDGSFSTPSGLAAPL